MYSQPETTPDSWHSEVSDNMRVEAQASQANKFISIRLEFEEDGTIRKIVNGSDYCLDCPHPFGSAVMERLIAEKIALLKLAPVSKTFKKVGRKYTNTVYYIRIFPEDIKRMEMFLMNRERHEV